MLVRLICSFPQHASPFATLPCGLRHFNQLPFAEDLRDYEFAPFTEEDEFKPSAGACAPTPASQVGHFSHTARTTPLAVQLAAAEELITGLDLGAVDLEGDGYGRHTQRPHIFISLFAHFPLPQLQGGGAEA